MRYSKKISRNKFFKILGSILILPFIYSWIFSIKRHQLINSGAGQLIIPLNLPPGISFINEIIINNQPEGFTVFSAKCTHLGCKIDNIENNHLICPCHGSVYKTDGSVIKGPSRKPLTKLKYSIDKEKANLIIELS